MKQFLLYFPSSGIELNSSKWHYLCFKKVSTELKVGGQRLEVESRVKSIS